MIIGLATYPVNNRGYRVASIRRGFSACRPRRPPDGDTSSERRPVSVRFGTEGVLT